MKSNKGPLNTNTLLWWIAIISLVIGGVIYYMFGQQAEIDVRIRQQRMIFPLVSVIIAGICAIVGTAGRWFYPK